MGRGYSNDLRARVVAIVEDGESAREAARLLNIGASTAIRWIEPGRRPAVSRRSLASVTSARLLKKYEQWLLGLVAEEPDLTLDEIRVRLRSEKKMKVAVSSIWRFYDRHKITFKKNSARGRARSS
jgi:transposase